MAGGRNGGSASLLVSVAFVVGFAGPGFAQSLPTGGAVAAGAATIASPSGTSLVVTQTSRNAIINWGSFSVGQGNSLAFQNGSGGTLNRVLGNVPSHLDGTITATGSLFLVNPAGVTVGTTGRIATGGSFLASTLDVPDADFMKGGDLTFKGASTASVLNYGEIGSLGGDVALIARKVENAGTIDAPNGTAALAAGYEVLVRDGDLDGGKFVVKVGGADTEAKTSGKIRAAAVELRANGGNVYALAGNTDGIVAATGTATQSGRIFLTAGDAGSVEVSQKVVARSAPTGGKTKGGAIRVSSKTVAVSATLDAKGDDAAGGSIAIEAGVLFNTGLLAAGGTSGGTVTVTARSVANSGSIDVSGLSGLGGTATVTAGEAYVETAGAGIEAGGTSAGGTIRIDAARIFTSGTLSAASTQGLGGAVVLTGTDIDLVAARVDASGATGGGRIRIGGDYQGGGTLSHATTLDISPATVIVADGESRGDGGDIVLWSDEATAFYGSVGAKGGTLSGDGGSIEISSKGLLTMAGTASAAATLGKKGTVLLDPKNIVISDATGVYPQYQLIDPNPSSGDAFGATTVALSTGNVVVTASGSNFGAPSAGAVYLYNATSGALISQLYGSHANDSVGDRSPIILTNGNYVLVSYNWSDGSTSRAGAVTWGSETSGVNGFVSSINSLVGSHQNDTVGNAGVTVLSNGNYVVQSSAWDSDTVSDVGAVTWGSGTSGVAGVVSAQNSLVGSHAGDQVGGNGVTALGNGNYVVRNIYWDSDTVSDAGAVTWGSGTSGVAGVVSAQNSLVGSHANDQVGNVFELSNGNYVVASYGWDSDTVSDVGAVTWGSGTSGVAGVVSAQNSLVGSHANDRIGSYGLTKLSNGNFVVVSPNWDSDTVSNVGAVTWGSGTTGIIGVVSAQNSLVGSHANDQVGGSGVLPLSNGSYVVRSANWHNDTVINAGAVTWGYGTTGIAGVVSAQNSLVGSHANDAVGNSVIELKNSNYVVASSAWDSDTVSNVGAVTWGSGTSGVTGIVSAQNSLVGSRANDQVGSRGVTVLSNGGYVVMSPDWDSDTVSNVGAVTWGSGTSDLAGVVSARNSLVGAHANDQVGGNGVFALSNGNYVVMSPNWDSDTVSNVGAVTWGSGTTGVTGLVSAQNSLVGSHAGDYVGSNSVFALSNGNYVVVSPNWDSDTVSNVGAVTWGSGTTGIIGVVSAQNSLVGSHANDQVGNNGAITLNNGNYVVRSTNWHTDTVINAGAVTWGNGTTGTAGVVSAQNSLVGSHANDSVGNGGVVGLANGNYVVTSYGWDSDTVSNVGAVTWGSGTSGVTGVVSAQNSLVGSHANDFVGLAGVAVLADSNYIVGSRSWDSDAVTDAGEVTWGSGASGVKGVVSAQNSLVGSYANESLGSRGEVASAGVFMAIGTSGQLFLGLPGINAASDGLTFSRATGQTITLTSAAIKSVLDAGTSLVLQASNDINVQSAITSSTAASLTLTAGRSITVGANISVGGNLTLTANAPLSAGVVNADRDAGVAAIDAAGFTLSSSGLLSLAIANGAGLTNNTSGDILVGQVSPNALAITNLGPSGGLISFASSITTSGAQTYTGNLRIAGTNVVLGSTNGTVTWTDQSSSSIVGSAAGNKVSFVSGGITIWRGVLDTSDAARIAIGSTAETRDYGAANPSAVPVLVSGTLRPGDTLTTLFGTPANTVWTHGTPTASSPVGSYDYTLDGSTVVIASGNDGYFVNLATVTGLMSVTPATLTATLIGPVTKVYDGGATATLASGNFTLSPTIGGDVVTLSSPTTGTYAQASVGSSLGVTASGLSLGGAAAGNYQLAATTVSANIGSITPATLTATLIGPVTKVYDGGTTATLASGNFTLSPAIGSDVVTLTSPTTGTYAQANVGSSLRVTASGLTLAGAAAANYQLAATTVSADVGAITPATLTATLGGTVTKVYDGGTTATLAAGNFTLSSAIGSDVVTLTSPTTGTYAQANVGSSLGVSASGLTLAGAAAGNYQLAATTIFADVGAITPATLTVTANNAVKTYDGLAFAGGDGVTYAGFANGEDASVLGGSITYAGASQGAVNAGTYALMASGQTSTNYALTYVDGVLTVAPRAITVAANDATMVSGSPVPALGWSITTGSLVNGDTLSGALAAAATAGSPAGVYAILQGTLAASANYGLIYIPGALTVTAAPVQPNAGGGSGSNTAGVPPVATAVTLAATPNRFVETSASNATVVFTTNSTTGGAATQATSGSTSNGTDQESGSGCTGGSTTSLACTRTPHPENRRVGRFLTFSAAAPQPGAGGASTSLQ